MYILSLSYKYGLIFHLKLKKKDEIITSPLTFCSAINSILHAGGKPVLADININNLTIKRNKLNNIIAEYARKNPINQTGEVIDKVVKVLSKRK